MFVKNELIIPYISPQNIFIYTILFLLVFQSLHMIDHSLQYIQRVLFGIDNAPGLFEGLLNANDTIIHIWLNIIDFIAIILLWTTFRESQLRELPRRGAYVSC